MKAKEKLYPVGTPSIDSEGSTELVKMKIRTYPPKYIVCCEMSNPKCKELKTTEMAIYFYICLVNLCTKKKGNRKQETGRLLVLRFCIKFKMSCLKGKLGTTKVNQILSRKRKASSKEKT